LAAVSFLPLLGLKFAGISIMGFPVMIGLVIVLIIAGLAASPPQKAPQQIVVRPPSLVEKVLRYVQSVMHVFLLTLTSDQTVEPISHQVRKRRR
jgi:hypothetical protein